MGRLSFAITWNTPRSTITSTIFGASLDLRTLSTRNVIERSASFADAFAFLIALAEMSVATTSKPRFARFIACVAGPVPRSRIRTPRRRCAFRARSMSVSRAGLYQGSVATSEVAYTFSQSPVGPVAPGGSTMPRAARGLAKALCLHSRSRRGLPGSGGVRSCGGAYPIRRLVRGRLEKPLDPPRVVDVHREGGGLLSEAGPPHDVPRDDHEQCSARRRSDPADLERPAGRRPEGALVIAQAELGLRNANRQTVQARIFEALEIVQGCGVVLHIGRTIDGRGDFRDLLLEGIVVLVDQPNAMSRGVGRFEDKPREGFAACAAIAVAGVRRGANAQVLAVVHDGVDLSVRVGGEAIHCHNGRHAERLQDLQVGVEVREAGSQGLEVLEGEVLLLHAAVVLQGAHAHDEDRGVRTQSALSAHEFHELLAAQVGAEARLRDDDVPEAEGESVRQDAAVPVRDVRERPAVNEGGRALERLHEVRHERVFQQDRGGTMHVEIANADGMLTAVICDDDPFEAGPWVVGAFGQTKDRHYLPRGRGDEAGLPRHAPPPGPEGRDDGSQRAVAHFAGPRG